VIEVYAVVYVYRGVSAKVYLYSDWNRAQRKKRAIEKRTDSEDQYNEAYDSLEIVVPECGD
jgi:hypothetical protein